MRTISAADAIRLFKWQVDRSKEENQNGKKLWQAFNLYERLNSLQGI
jgi:hypothetical protein